MLYDPPRIAAQFTGTGGLGFCLPDRLLADLVVLPRPVEAEDSVLLLDLVDLVVGVEAPEPLVQPSEDRVPPSAVLYPASPAVGDAKEE